MAVQDRHSLYTSEATLQTVPHSKQKAGVKKERLPFAHCHTLPQFGGRERERKKVFWMQHYELVVVHNSGPTHLRGL